MNDILKGIMVFFEAVEGVIITVLSMLLGFLGFRLLLPFITWLDQRNSHHTTPRPIDDDDDDEGYVYYPQRTLRGQISGKGRHKARPIQRKRGTS